MFFIVLAMGIAGREMHIPFARLASGKLIIRMKALYASIKDHLHCYRMLASWNVIEVLEPLPLTAYQFKIQNLPKSLQY